ncbi:S-adenosyl-L-methionine-dependent methyltransferase [Pelomyxa schiedti]|nr:S-adenosyl-L-methionine-dependent methyltransferase [Pelomyxa schiedti]
MAMMYRDAAKIMAGVLMFKGTPRTLAFSTPGVRNPRGCYAVVAETAKCQKVLCDCLKDTGLLSGGAGVMGGSGGRAKTVGNMDERTAFRNGMVLVLVRDMLLGGGIRSNGSLEKEVLRHEKEIREAFAKYQAENLPAKPVPKCARVNTLMTSVSSLMATFSSKLATVDSDIPELLHFAPDAKVHTFKAVKKGSLIIQSKPSCIPAMVLNPPQGSHVIDSCSAPGNKTSHLAAIMNNTGKIYAFDKDKKRLDMMLKLLEQRGVKNVTATCQDFIKVSPRDKQYSSVTHILVDPSCSGSGMLDRPEMQLQTVEEKPDLSRLRQLRKFQLLILRHALSFPNVQRVVYSTCSIHQEENEDVVRWALTGENATDITGASSSVPFELEKVLPSWPHRGLPLFTQAENCIRVDPKEDQATGFFVACFVRKSHHSTITNQIPSSHVTPPLQSTSPSPLPTTAAKTKPKAKPKPKPKPKEKAEPIVTPAKTKSKAKAKPKPKTKTDPQSTTSTSSSSTTAAATTTTTTSTSTTQSHDTTTTCATETRKRSPPSTPQAPSHQLTSTKRPRKVQFTSTQNSH